MLDAKQSRSPCSLEGAVFQLQDKLQAASRLEGRPAAIDALLAVAEFLSVISGPGERAHQRPINELISSLLSLDDGKSLPLLEPVRRPVRPRNPIALESAKGFAVYAAERLRAGGMDMNDAYEKVALVCRQAGLRPGRKGARDQKSEMTDRTIREWRAAVAADIGCHTRAGRQFASLMSVPLPDGLIMPDELLARLRSFLADARSP